ncbi:MAG: hypothetical protein ABI647_13345 [Gemmatimonadota bacterium]
MEWAPASSPISPASSATTTAAIVAGNAGRAAHTGAREAIRVKSSELLATIRQLEGMLLLQFEGNPNLEGAWRSARNVPWSTRRAREASPEGVLVEPPGVM